MKYPHEFLGRCQTCLDNAYLSADPCAIGYGNGMPLYESQCAIRFAQKQYDAERISSSGKMVTLETKP